MWAAPGILIYVLFLIGGTALAIRIIYRPGFSANKFSLTARRGGIIVVGWVGIFVVSAIARQIGMIISMQLVFPDDPMTVFDLLYGETMGENILNLLTGWVWGIIFMIIARALVQRESVLSDPDRCDSHQNEK